LTEAHNWNDIWAGRRLDPTLGSRLAQLLAIDGYDTPFATVSEETWTAHVAGWAETLGLIEGSSVFEIGCGAGAFLYPLAGLGCRVGGLDRSPALVDVARAVLPDGVFLVTEAAEMELQPTVDVVVSCAAFLYFPSLEYASQVIERAARKARRAVLVLDLPDAACRDAALAHRVASLGGEEAYQARYSGLDHLYYSREWFEEALRSAGLGRVQVADQNLAGYVNGRFRFNAWGFAGESAGWD